MQSSLASVLAFGEKTPDIHPSVFLADGARITGDVTIGPSSSVWFNAVVRGDVHWVRIGTTVNVQDNAVLHVTNGTAPLLIEDDVTIGHAAVVHGCTVRRGALIGMGAVVLDHAVVGARSLVAAGSIVRMGMTIPDGLLVAGNPAGVRRDRTAADQESLVASATRYAGYAQTYIQTYQER